MRSNSLTRNSNAIVAAFGPLAPDPLSPEEIARHRRAATNLVDKAGFDN